MTANESDQNGGSGENHAGEDGPAEADADVDPFRIESRLTSHAIYVSEFEGTEESGYELAYESMAADEGTVPHRELGRVINVFLDVFGEDWRGTRIDATVCDLDGNSLATWHCEQAWLAGLADGDLTEVEFSRKVVDTLEQVDR